MQARLYEKTTRVGRFVFVTNNDGHGMTCRGRIKTSITHNNKNVKRAVEFEWRADDNYGDIEFV